MNATISRKPSERTKLTLNYDTFCTNVRKYEEEELGERVIHKEERGFFAEPHNNIRVQLSTEAVERHSPNIDQYGTILFIEKTGYYTVGRKFR